MGRKQALLSIKQASLILQSCSRKDGKGVEQVKINAGIADLAVLQQREESTWRCAVGSRSLLSSGDMLEGSKHMLTITQG